MAEAYRVNCVTDRMMFNKVKRMKIFHLLGFTLIFPSVKMMGQKMDTVVSRLNYVVHEVFTEEGTEYQFFIKNTFHHNSETNKQASKIFLMDAKEKDLRDEKIIDPTEMTVLNDSVLTFTVYPFHLVNPKYTNEVDSLFLMYWKIGELKLGPISYFPEPDLINCLDDPSSFSRALAAKTLQQLMSSGKNTIRQNHVIEHTPAYWEQRLASLTAGMTLRQIEDILPADALNYSQGDSIIYQLDHSYAVSLSFDAAGYLQKHHLHTSYRKMDRVLPDTIGNSRWKMYRSEKDITKLRTYYVNGKKFKEYTVYPQQKTRLEEFYENGQSAKIDAYENGVLVQTLFHALDGTFTSTEYSAKTGKTMITEHDVAGHIRKISVHQNGKLHYRIQLSPEGWPEYEIEYDPIKGLIKKMFDDQQNVISERTFKPKSNPKDHER